MEVQEKQILEESSLLQKNGDKKKFFVSVKDESIEMFDHPIPNFFSRMHFSIPLIIFIPAIFVALYMSITSTSLSLLNSILYFALGAFVWSFTEYFFHRFVFHYHPTSKIGKYIHFVAHGVHHDYPNDSLRLVLPPIISVPLAIMFFFLYSSLLGAGAYTTFAGFVTGYLCYDMTHYAVHHVNWNNPWFKAMKHHHMKHHFQDPDNGYGVSNTLWDYVFKTTFKK